MARLARVRNVDRQAGDGAESVCSFIFERQTRPDEKRLLFICLSVYDLRKQTKLGFDTPGWRCLPPLIS